MLNNLLKDIETIYIAYGPTDFRKQIDGLCSIVKEKYHKNPYEKACFIFYNQRRDSIKILSYDKNRICIGTEEIN